MDETPSHAPAPYVFELLLLGAPEPLAGELTSRLASRPEWGWRIEAHPSVAAALAAGAAPDLVLFGADLPSADDEELRAAELEALGSSAGRSTPAALSLACLRTDGLPARDLERALLDAIELRRMEQTLAAHVTLLEQANDDLVRRNDEIRRFYQTVAHELRTPLTSSREFASILRDGLAGPVNDEQRRYLDYVVDGCDHLARSIDDLFDAARIETGRLQLSPERLDLARLVEDTVEGLRPQAELAGLELGLDVAGELPPVNADAERVYQVLANLVGNAFKFTPAGGRVEVGVEHLGTEGVLSVHVRDTGHGLHAAELDRIFDRLYQVADETGRAPPESTSGLGLGLHIARDLVRLHGGELSVASEPERGSTFTFTLPVTPIPEHP